MAISLRNLVLAVVAVCGLFATLLIAADPAAANTPPVGSCTVLETGDDTVTVVWNPEEATRKVMHIRRNGEWATTAFGVGTSSVTVTGSTQDSWVVRYATSTRNQSRVDLTCTAGQAVDSCTVAARGNDVRLDWNKVADAERYQVRSNGKWVASTPATGVTVPGSTEDTWIIRTRVKGAVVDLPCSADGIEPTSPCTVTIVNDLTVNIDWDDVDGVDRYQVRANGRWQGSSTTSDFDYSPVRVEFALGSPYEIRYWSNGERNSIFC